MSRPRLAVSSIFLIAFVLITVLSLGLCTGVASAAEAGEVDLVFIHHSVGANWLHDGLCSGLNASGYHVADIYYGWTGGTSTVYGDHTDTSDWPTWFTDSVMGLVYPEMDAMTAPNTLSPASGENTVIMFKSCYPNSDVGSSNSDEKAIYSSLLNYFEDHPDKMFVLVTPPPMASISNPWVTRELCNWLTDSENGWLKDLSTGNVFVFDLYNVLTHPDAHHAWVGGTEVHQVVAGANILYSGYHSGGDNHPNYTGNAKAAAEFVPLLDAWYEQFQTALGTLPIRFQQTDARLTYLGEWSTGKSLSASGGSFCSSDSVGAAALIEFSGTEVRLVGRTTPWYGQATVKLDGGPEESVEFYSPSVAYRQIVYTRDGLDDGPHTLVVKRTGVSDPASLGTAISLDAVDILGILEQADIPTRYQEDSPDFEYAGTWDSGSTWSASGGTFVSADSAGSSASVSFNGTYLAWVARTTPWYGEAQVSLDGGPLQTVDLYSSSIRYKHKVYDSGLLEEGTHTLHVYWTGDKNVSSLGTRISIDAFDMFGTPTASDPAPFIVWRYEDDDPRITYLGTWHEGVNQSASGGGFKSTDSQVESAPAVLVKFTGTEITVLARTTPWYGMARITLDGVTTELVDLYSGSVTHKVPVYERTGLSTSEEHTLVIEHSSTRNDDSLGWAISLDALDIKGYLSDAPVLTRSEQDEAGLEYQGDWLTVANSSSSGDSYSYTDSQGASVNIVFEGSYLAWRARTAPWYGCATVMVDGGPGDGLTVDLYSSSVKYDQKVFDTGLLDDGTHTVSIHCSNRWWMPYSGSGINVDALDVIGTLGDADAAEPVPTHYDQDESRVTYLGRWVSVSNSGCMGGSYAYTDTRGAAALLEFTGTALDLGARTAPWYGKALVTVDGAEHEVDFYSPSVTTGTVYHESGLSPGRHSVSIECLGENGGAPDGCCGIALDNIYLHGYLTQASQIVRVQEDDTVWVDSGDSTGEIVYEGDWATSGDTGWRASGNSFVSVDKAGAKVTLTMHGTYVSWLSRSTPWYGIARVSLYEGETASGDLVSTETVDLWSPTVMWKKPAYDTGLLPDGAYTLVIECLGSGRAASWGTAVAVDAFDVLATVP